MGIAIEKEIIKKNTDKNIMIAQNGIFLIKATPDVFSIVLKDNAVK